MAFLISLPTRPSPKKQNGMKAASRLLPSTCTGWLIIFSTSRESKNMPKYILLPHIVLTKTPSELHRKVRQLVVEAGGQPGVQPGGRRGEDRQLGKVFKNSSSID